MKKHNVTGWPVRKVCCPTCPFRIDPATNRERDIELANRIRTSCLTQASQICHHPALSGKKEHELCRGARDFQLMIFHRLGFLDAPSDESWERTQKNGKRPSKHRSGDRPDRRLNRPGSDLSAAS